MSDCERCEYNAVAEWMYEQTLSIFYLFSLLLRRVFFSDSKHFCNVVCFLVSKNLLNAFDLVFIMIDYVITSIFYLALYLHIEK